MIYSQATPGNGAQGRGGPASREIARIGSMTNPAAALRTLEGIRADAAGRGLPRFEFDARRGFGFFAR